MQSSPLPSPSPTSVHPLARELVTFRRLLPTLLDRHGQFAVISGDRLVGVYPSWKEATAAGYHEVGLSTPLFVKEIEEVETIQFFTRDLGV